MKYDKPHLSYEEQLLLLIERGLKVKSPEFALRHLRMIGYYRLKAYWFQWREQDTSDDGSPSELIAGNHHLEEAIALYAFDRRLRLLLLDALERIEVACRVEIAHVLGRRGAFPHLDPACLRPSCNEREDKGDSGQTRYEKFLECHKRLVERSHEQFAIHFRKRYDSEPPIWVAVEMWDFGTLATFYSIASNEDQIEIARRFGLSDYKLLASWLGCLNQTRNVCAHHGRLFRRTPVNKPRVKGVVKIPDLAHIAQLSDMKEYRAQGLKLYPTICIIVFMMNTIVPDSYWPRALVRHLNHFPRIPGNSLKDYGFPAGWQRECLWSRHQFDPRKRE